MKHIFFSAGEPSGDLHASKVLSHLSDFRLSGLGGDAMAEEGLETTVHIRETAVMGFTEVLLNYRRLRRIFNRTVDTLKKEKPDLLVCVDYPGFNLKLAKAATGLGIPVLYYIAPKVWAWGRGRLKRMKRTINRLAVIFPFEEDYFKKAGLNAAFVGNPLSETDYPAVSRSEFLTSLGLTDPARVLALLPGSRVQEVNRLLPPMVEAANRLLEEKRFDACVVSKAAGISEVLINTLTNGRFFVHPDNPGPLFEHSDFLVVKSGTANLEAALKSKPFVMVYKTSPLSWFIGRRLVKISAFSLPNILCQRSVVPELLQGQATGANIAHTAAGILDSETRQQDMLGAFTQIKESFGGRSPSVQVATLIREMVYG